MEQMRLTEWPKRGPHQVGTGLLVSPIINSSVRELCKVDHDGDEETIDEWVANGVTTFLNADYQVYVSDDFVVLGVAAMMNNGEVVTNYVTPAGVGFGVGKMLMDHLETRAQKMGLRAVRLTSTAAARHFYRRRGYVEWTPPEKGAGISWNHLMLKRLHATL